MSLTEELEALTPARPNNCRVFLVRSQLTPDENLELDGILQEPEKWSSAKVAKVLSKRDPDIKDSAVVRHRAGHCRCERTN